MVELRRSGRQRVTAKRKQVDDNNEDERWDEDESEEENSFDDDDDDASEEEYVPPSKSKGNNSNGRRNKRIRFDESSDDSTEGGSITEEEGLNGKKKRGRKQNESDKEGKNKIVLKTKPAVHPEIEQHKSQNTVQHRQEEIPPAQDESEDEQTRQEAQRLWDEIRARKAQQKENGGEKGKKSVQNKPPGGLDSWLGIGPPAWPSTCEEAMINDRDSLFVGFVYALTSSSQTFITQCLSHLNKVVQPQAIARDRYPPAMQHLPNNRRGATHDMYAWRALTLKPGRDGLGGPEDFGLEEGQEDDGEKFGAKEIAKAIRLYGATDVLVIVSRWYGGTMLGPARFRHIENCAKAALARHMVNEAMSELKSELKSLDERIAELRSRNGSSSSTPSSQVKTNAYDDLQDPEKAQRLIMARKKQIEILQRPKKSIVENVAERPSQQESENNVEPATLDGMNAEEEEAALEVLREMEKEEEILQNKKSQSTNEEETVKVKEEEINETPILNATRNSSAKVKVESPPLHDSIPTSSPVTAVKEEIEDETDLTGWDEL